MWVVPGKHRVTFLLGEADERPLEGDESSVEVVDAPPRPEPEVRGDLVVARPPGMEAPGQRPDLVRERGLEVHVDVLEVRVPRQPARGGVPGERDETFDERVDLVRRQHPGPPEPADVRDRTRDVIEGECLVDLDRTREIGDVLVGVLGKSPTPRSHAASLGEVRMLPGASAAIRTRARTSVGPGVRESKSSAHLAQPGSGILGRQVALRLGEQLVSDHELADVARSSGG